ncbi:hypothetical protein BGM26_16150 [Bacillus sp. FJAT-29790]|uniref:hypothetical protein n=1 Tax=Bacillus sp. FJAT-29790 TaxID=1895002 RepID=UPI001C22D235|nr:hypothetical protein [Bacillus sp. FJAT-29790]MBU8880487.1 hypothetical protein [Bacillus sp. FJAT-29790]
MKNFIYKLSLIVLSGIVTACTNETNASINIEKTTYEKNRLATAKDKPAVVQEGKEKKDTVWLKEKSLYQFEAMDGMLEYNVFLFAEDEQSILNEEDRPEGKKGDPIKKGHYSVYLAEKDSTVAFKQDVFDDLGALIFNSKTEQGFSLNLGNKMLIAIIQHEDQGYSTPYIIAIKDGEIKRVQLEGDLPFIFGTQIKIINQKYMQTAHLLEDRDFVFITWEFDAEAMTLLKLDESYLKEGSKAENLGEYWYKLWSEKREHYFPFLNLELTKDVIEKAKKGIPLGSPYPIGTNITEIKKTDPNFMEEGFQNGEPYLMYPEITYYYEEASGIVTAVSIPGERMKTTLEEVKKLFGEPFQEGKDDLNDGIRAVYMADKYIIEIVTDEDGKVTSVYLRKK